MPKIKVSSGSYDGAGRFIPECKVTVLDEGTSSLSTIYSDQAGTAKTNPFFADDSGTWEFYADPGLFDISVQRRGAAIFTQNSVAVGFVPYPQRPGGTISASTAQTVSTNYTESNAPFFYAESYAPSLSTTIGNPILYLRSGVVYVAGGQEFDQSDNPTGLPDSNYSHAALKYTGNFTRTFLVYFSWVASSHNGDTWETRMVTVDGDDWEAGVYTQKTVTEFPVETTWTNSLGINHLSGMNVYPMRVEPGDVVTGLIYADVLDSHPIADVKLVVKP